MTDNIFAKTRIEFHILQSFPVTCLNRDDVGAPKSAIVGGVSRARVSSQCWKRQVRLALRDTGVTLAMRTKNLFVLLKDACISLNATEEQAEKVAQLIAETLSKDTLVFFADAEVKALAQWAQEMNFFTESVPTAKDLEKSISKTVKKVRITAANGLDVALFGRMVAKPKDISVEAAVCFSHAITTHKAISEVEFFTALDDLPEETSVQSSHMGSLEYASGTFYRYVCLDLGQLAQTLGLTDDEALKEDMKIAIDAFVKALYTAVPSARQHTQAGLCGWDYARVLVRQGQPLQCSFEQPVRMDREKGGGYLRPSQEVLDKFIADRERMSGSLFSKKADYTLSETHGSVDELIDVIQKAVL